MRRFARGFGFALVLLGSAALAAGEEAPKAPEPALVFAREGPLVSGYASVPWAAAYSPDGRWLAVVEGYHKNRIWIHDAKSGSLAWEATTEGQTASFRPSFTRDGKRLILVEGEELVVRAHGEKDWEAVRRVPIGFTPSVGTILETIALSADEREAAVCRDGKVVRISLDGESKATAIEGVAGAKSVSFLRSGGLRVARWSEKVAETVFVKSSGPTPDPIPFAVLAASADDATWLVARQPHPASEHFDRITLELVDSATQAMLGPVVVGGDPRFHWVTLNQAEFTPDGRHLLTVECLRTGVVREARTGKVLQRIVEYEGDRMIGMALAPDGRTLLTGGRRPEEEFVNQALLLWRR